MNESILAHWPGYTFTVDGDERLRRKERRERDNELFVLFLEDVQERFTVSRRYSGIEGAEDWAQSCGSGLSLATRADLQDPARRHIHHDARTYISNKTLHAIFQRVLGCLTWDTGELKLEDCVVRETIGDEGWIEVKVRLLSLPPSIHLCQSHNQP